jgi:formiminoglutamase
MLHNWLKTLSKPIQKYAADQPEYTIGNRLVLYRDDFPDLKKVRVAIVGADAAVADACRMALYPLVAGFPSGTVADIGNLRKSDANMLMPVLYELVTGGVVPIILGRDHALASAQFLAYQEAKALVNWAVIDETLRLSGALESVLSPRHPLLFHFALVGAQSHLLPPADHQMLDRNNFELVRLGRSRAALEEVEPVLRDADLLTFHLNALKMSEIPDVTQPTPSGYFLEEACQLVRYAGMSDKLTSFGLYGWQPSSQSQNASAQVVAQLAWYFMDGYFNRKGDYPVSQQRLTEYVVDYPKLNYQLIFWHSARSGRWWMQVPTSNTRKHQRHRLVPCSTQDYQAACRQELPDRLMAALQRF